MQTHIVPVGFDYDRLIAPLVRDQLDVDRVRGRLRLSQA